MYQLDATIQLDRPIGSWHKTLRVVLIIGKKINSFLLHFSTPSAFDSSNLKLKVDSSPSTGKIACLMSLTIVPTLMT